MSVIKFGGDFIQNVEPKITNYKNTCRLCLRDEAELTIFTTNSTLLQNIQTYCKLEIFKDDGLPDKICKFCSESLRDVVAFICQCEESDRILRKAHNLEIKDFIKSECKLKLELNPDDDEHNYNNDDVSTELLSIKTEDIDSDDCLVNIISKRSLTDSSSTSSASLKKQKTPIVSANCEKNKSNRFERKVKMQKKKSEKYKFKSCQKAIKSASRLCPICGKIFSRRPTFQNHLSSHDEAIFACSKCSKKFTSEARLQKHEKVHLMLRGFPCQICGKTFASSCTSKRHMDIVHKKLKVVSCKICHKTLNNAKALKIHMKIHTGEKEFECNICNKRFTYKVCLTIHTRVHTGERPYHCRFCESRFMDRKSLKDHERLHTGEKPYVCSVCSKGFMRGSNLKSHFKNNHKGIEFKKIYVKNVEK